MLARGHTEVSPNPFVAGILCVAGHPVLLPAMLPAVFPALYVAHLPSPPVTLLLRPAKPLVMRPILLKAVAVHCLNKPVSRCCGELLHPKTRK